LTGSVTCIFWSNLCTSPSPPPFLPVVFLIHPQSFFACRISQSILGDIQNFDLKPIIVLTTARSTRAVHWVVCFSTFFPQLSSFGLLTSGGSP
jgi:hypothetical protein